jgi:predicted TIM-barrel fold metal-dependent hydrolase
MSNPTNDMQAQSTDKVAEYFQLKNTAKTLRRDMKDLRTQHEDYEELEKLSKKVKELRDNIKNDQAIHELKEKIDQIKERMDLLKELIRVELIETAEEEVKKDGRKLKLVQVLKEMKEDED